MIEKIELLKKAANDYLIARTEFLKYCNETKELSGNDNIIGRIGEFVAYQYLTECKRKPDRPNSNSQKGYDIICDNGKTKISVKTLTSESKTGRSTRLTFPWDELFIISINENLKVEKFGILTKKQFLISKTKGHLKSSNPYVTKSMLGQKGLIRKFGKYVDPQLTLKYL